MKKFQLLSCIFGIAILLSSCASQHRLELVGHYKPNTEVAKNKASAPVSHSDEMMTSLPFQNENKPVATTDETATDLELRNPDLTSIVPPIVLTEKQEKKADKKFEKVKVKLEKHATLSGKQIQQSDLLLDKHKRKFTHAGDATVLYIIFAILLPPLAVFLYEDDITNHFWIDLLLTILGWVPGIIYALIIVLGGVHDSSL